MEEKILDELLKNTYTLEGLRKRYQVLKKKIEGEIYSKVTDESKESEEPEGSKDAGESEESKESEGAKDLIHSTPPTQAKGLDSSDSNSDSFDSSLLESIKNDDFVKLNAYIENFIKSAQSLSVYLVFSLEKEQLKEIGEWMRTNLKNPRLVFDIKVDAALIGGCAIAYKGVYKDYSLRAKITANKEKLIHEFREYFKQ
jgi:hypothetical protein